MGVDIFRFVSTEGRGGRGGEGGGRVTGEKVARRDNTGVVFRLFGDNYTIGNRGVDRVPDQIILIKF